MELLGFIDLLDLAAPTEISASLDDRSNEWLQLPGGGDAEPSRLTLSNETDHQSFISGVNSAKRPPVRNGGAPGGTVTTYDVGALADPGDADPAAVVAMGKDHWYTVDATKTMVAVTRADRNVVFLTVDDTGLLSVTKMLCDSRLLDPIAAEDVNDHGTESYVVTVADYAGGAAKSYRYGPVIMHTNGELAFGIGPSGSDVFEYGGAFLPGGSPFQISTTSVP